MDYKDSINKVYEVEKIINCKFHRNKKYYLIKWLCYPISESTWEPKSNIKHLRSILAKFEESYPESVDHEMYDIYCAGVKKSKRRSKKAPKKEEIPNKNKFLNKKKKIEDFTRAELKDAFYAKLRNHLYIHSNKKNNNKMENEVIIELSSNTTTQSDEIGSILLSDKENLDETDEKEAIEENQKLIMPILE